MVAAGATSCESLSSLVLPNTTITSSQAVAAGGFMPPASPGRAGGSGGGGQAFAELPAFCRVAATLKPSSDSDIRVEVWLPAEGWNGKFETAAVMAPAAPNANVVAARIRRTSCLVNAP